MRRALVLAALLLVLLAPAAHGQANPFSTPESAVPTATPAGSADDDDSRTLLLIAGGVLVVFIGIGWFITRDARGNLTASDRRAIERGDTTTKDLDDERGTGAVGGKRKAKRRSAGKRQRQARKANRPRRR